MGFLMVAMLLLRRFAGMPWPGGPRDSERTVGHGKPVDLNQWGKL
jgi:hypothetical protein